jgi:UDP-3-O-acyl N-acetylglucosamine deacetylase
LYQNQRTIASTITVSGSGIHTGQKVNLVIQQSTVNSGVKFWFTSGGGIRLLPRNAFAQKRGTNLSKVQKKVKTVEHFLAALSAKGITNLRVIFANDGEVQEMPILDGCAQEWTRLLDQAGVVEQEALQRPLIIEEPIQVWSEDRYIKIEPAEKLSVTCLVEFPIIGKSEATYISGETDFAKEIAPARTFGFEAELKELEASGLAKGATIENALLIKDDGSYSTPLRFPNEPARHKLLDVLGDIYTLGRPVVGRITAYKPGHALNVSFVKRIAGMG